jgi:uncharacterized glyoxalase superfamily protein PhnB
MRVNRSMPAAAIIPVVEYPDVPAAMKRLEEAFGFEIRLRIGAHRAQLQFGGGAIVVSQSSSPDVAPGSGHSVMVRVESVDAHLSRARRHGARIVRDLEDFPTASANTPASIRRAIAGIRRAIAGRFPRQSPTSTPPIGAASYRATRSDLKLAPRSRELQTVPSAAETPAALILAARAGAGAPRFAASEAACPRGLQLAASLAPWRTVQAPSR